MRQIIVATVRIVVDQPEIIKEMDVASGLCSKFPGATVSVKFDGGFTAGYNDADSRHRYPDMTGQ